MKIPVLPLDSMYQMPAAQHPGDAGADLAAAESVTLEPGARALVSTGFAVAIPDGHAGLVMPRSGLAIRSGITVINAPGLIDSGYRGEVKVALVNHSQQPFTIEPGDRIAQLVVIAVESPVFVAVDELPDSRRGEGGFGSTGIAAADPGTD